MSKEEIFGSFYLSLTDSGNLLGEYTHKSIRLVFTESVIVISNDSLHPFIGNYHSSWIETENAPSSENTHLTIRFKDDFSSTKYSLEWKNTNGDLIFEGDGFLVNGKLIGCYWN